MLKNKTYVGILKSGDTYSENIEYLRIIDDSTFDGVQEIMKGNIKTLRNENQVLLKTQVICADLVYCGCCGKKMTLSTSSKKYIRKNGTIYNNKKIKYKCPSKSQFCHCDGKTTHSANVLDSLVIEVLTSTFLSGKDSSKKQIVHQNLYDISEKIKAQIIQLQETLIEKEGKYLEMKENAVDVIRGKSTYSPVEISQLIDKQENDISNIKAELHQLDYEQQLQLKYIDAFDAECKVLKKKLTLLSELGISEKQDIIHKYIKIITIGEDWKIDIVWQF